MNGFARWWNDTQLDVHDIAVEHGWWEGGERNFGEAVALMHSELSEALEGHRNGDPASDHIKEFSSIEEEFADVVIRIMDVSEKLGYRIPEAILAKIEYNRSRPYRHGKAY